MLRFITKPTVRINGKCHIKKLKSIRTFKPVIKTSFHMSNIDSLGDGHTDTL